MTLSSKNDRPDRPGFIFVGEHPAIDFANTLSLSQTLWIEHLRDWADVIDWLALAGLSANPALQVPTSRSVEAVESVVELRRAWKDELSNLVTGSGRVSDDFIRRINHILAEDACYEILHRSGKTGFQLNPSASRLRGEKLALATVSRQIAHFLAEANFGYLHRCANTTSCALYFYDTTKNHRRQWCSTATCGNQSKVAAFRRRHAKHTI